MARCSPFRAPEFPEFPAALSFVMALTHQEAQAAQESVRSTGLPRLFLIEEEHKQAMAEAELEWVGSLPTEMKSGTITWNPQWLREVAAQFGGADSA